MVEQSKAFREGARMGENIEANAIDCPYLPPDMEHRNDWMAGFGSTRPLVSAASDPAKVTAAREQPGDEHEKPQAIG